MRTQAKTEPVPLPVFATWDDDDVAVLNLSTRFNAIRLILSDIRNRAPAPPDDPLKPVCEEQFGLHITSLEKLARSIRFTTHFDFLQTEVVKQTLERIADDHSIGIGLSCWNMISDDHRESVLQAIDDLRRKSARDVLPIPVRVADMEFFECAKDSRGNLTMGSFYGSIDQADGEQRIKVNTHTDARYDDALETSCTVYHEGGGHANQFALGWTYKFYRHLVPSELARDAQINCLRYAYAATIPVRISGPYFAQCHENDAYKQERLFKEGLEKILVGDEDATIPRAQLEMAAKCG